MDREFFTFSPIKARPLFKWPGGARIALWVVPNIEHYEYLPGPVRVRNPWPRMPHPDVLGYSLREYGNRVGFWRMLDVMDKHKIRCTISLNVANFEMHPEIMHAAKRVDMTRFATASLTRRISGRCPRMRSGLTSPNAWRAFAS